MRVLFIPTFLTTPRLSPTIMKSPISKGLSKNMEKEAKMSLKICCRPKARTIPITPKLATTVVMS